MFCCFLGIVVPKIEKYFQVPLRKSVQCTHSATKVLVPGKLVRQAEEDPKSMLEFGRHPFPRPKSSLGIEKRGTLVWLQGACKGHLNL